MLHPKHTVRTANSVGFLSTDSVKQGSACGEQQKHTYKLCMHQNVPDVLVSGSAIGIHSAMDVPRPASITEQQGGESYETQ